MRSNAAYSNCRYEFFGTPLPFSAKSKPYQLLYTSAPSPGSLFGVTRPAHSATEAAPGYFKRYDKTCSALPKCPYCQSARTFELQLMPNLLSVLERDLSRGAAEEETERELGWATVWCFVCSADCLDAQEAGGSLDWQGWREEIALVEIET